MKRLEAWFKTKKWKPFEYQRQSWDAYLAGHSGLVHAPTGMGKSYSVWLGPILEYLAENPAASSEKSAIEPIRVLWITPMRALANDLLGALEAPVRGLSLPWAVEARTGDTSSSMRRKQRAKLPTALVTTPESLSLLLSYPDAREKFKTLRAVVVDEWHELLGAKRGVQTELGLARLRSWLPGLRTWGLSATLGNLPEALEVLLGAAVEKTPGVLISGKTPKQVEITTLLPENVERFPWSGHLGVRLLDQVVAQIEKAQSTLLFTNTRSQAEIWFQAVLHARPEWAAELALHHGSLDRGLREFVEDRLRQGYMRCVVCTSSLDLGVDFSPVDQVIQVGSPKGIARLLQRAGRSGHQPGAVSRVVCVPTHTFELVEYAAAREAALAGRIEGRQPHERPLDVPVQHLVTMALAEPFIAEELMTEVRTTHAFRELSPAEWQWALDFVTRGGPALKAYPQFARLIEQEGRYHPASPQVARLHRMSIGTITSDTSVQVKFVAGGKLGTVEESFIARMRPGDTFVFAGRLLELVRVRELTAYVRRATKSKGQVPRWDGGRFPVSTELGEAVRRQFALARDGFFESPELQSARPVLELQSAWSHLPDPTQVLIEHTRARDGYQWFVYPFEGRLVNEGLAALLAYRISRELPRTITMTVNDYGLELLSTLPLELDEAAWRRLLSPDKLLEDLLGCLNTVGLARRQFRDIARIAGLIFVGYPGQPKTVRQVQASSGLLFDVLTEYDPENLLLDQARREVLERQLESSRLRQALERMSGMQLRVVHAARLTPLSFPLWAARIQTSHMSSERWSDRVRRMAVQLEEVASGRPASASPKQEIPGKESSKKERKSSRGIRRVPR